MLFTIAFSLASFLLVAVSTIETLVLLGVVCASVSSGFGEIIFLSLTTHYHKSAVSGWSSGTGGAGVGGAVVYAVLVTFLSPMVTLLIQLFVPVMMFLTYFILLGPFKSNLDNKRSDLAEESSQCQTISPEVERDIEDELEVEQTLEEEKMLKTSPTEKSKTFSLFGAYQRRGRKSNDSLEVSVKLLEKKEAKFWLSHIKYIPHLLQYMIPLFLVYFAEYAINQGFFELLYNSNTHIGGYCLDQRTQYRWYQVVYQVGVLISRSSVSVIYIRHFWILSLLQVCIL